MVKQLPLIFSLAFLVNISNAQWVTNGPYAGAINCLVVNDSFIGAGTNGNGVILSTDKGSTWRSVAPSANSNVSSLAISDSNIYAAVNYYVFTSSDYGTNWLEQDPDVPYLGAATVLAIRNSNQFGGVASIFAGSNVGSVQLSDNNGEDWVAVDSGLPAYVSISSLVINNAGVFAGTYSDGIFLLSNDSGNWVQVNTGLADSVIYSMAVNDSNIFAGTKTGLFMSANNGGNWSAVNNGLPDTGILSLAIKDSNIFAGTCTGDIYFSSNSGYNWVSVYSGPTGVYNPITALAISDSSIYAGTDSGSILLSTNNGSSWITLYNDLTGTSIGNLSLSGTTIVAGSETGIFASTNNCNNWAAVNNGLTSRPFSLAVSGSNICVGSIVGLFFSGDNGANWAAVNALDYSTITALAVRDSTICAGTYFGPLFVSNDNASTWFYTNLNLWENYVTSIIVSGTNFFLSTGGGDATSSGSVFMSIDDGGTWLNVTNNLPEDRRGATIAGGPGDLFAFTDNGMSFNGVFLSTDSGRNWVAYNNLPGNGNVAQIAVIGSNIFALDGLGNIYLSTNHGSNWTQVSTDGVQTSIVTLAVSDSILAVGTSGAGVWQRPISQIPGFISGIATLRRAGFKLYPNPATNSFTIEITSTGQQLMQLFDITGQLILSQNIYNNKTTIDAGNLATGIYIVSLKNRDVLATQKLVIAK